MATATRKKTTKPKESINTRIRNAYKHFILMHGDDPASIYAFTKELKIAEDTFYKHFSSFESVKQSIWNDFMAHTRTVLEKDKSYADFSVREKLLSFYYTLIEVLKADRSFVMLCVRQTKKSELTPTFLKAFKEDFNTYANELIGEGIETNEVQDRPVIGKRYSEALWLQLMFVVNFWVNDTSKKFEKTDAAIEKAVGLSFDLMQPGPLDSMVDFAKFLYQNRR